MADQGKARGAVQPAPAGDEMVVKPARGSYVRRLLPLLASHGPLQTASVFASVLEDHWLHLFDRWFGVKTSGYIALDQTSLAGSETRNFHRYRGVNAWAFRKMLRQMMLDKAQRFVDLGSGLGRACLLAAEYGFSRVTGVELVGEFCSVACRNVEACVAKQRVPKVIRILNMDAREYTAKWSDDVYFLYRPFSGEVLRTVCENIRKHSRVSRSPATLLYSERLVQTDSHHGLFSQDHGMQEMWSGTWWGQRFWGFRI